MRKISFNIAVEDEESSSLFCASSQDNKKSTLARKSGRRIGRSSGPVEGETHIWLAGNPESPSSSCQARGYKKKNGAAERAGSTEKRLPRRILDGGNFLR